MYLYYNFYISLKKYTLKLIKMDYENWLESIKDHPKELVKFNREVYGKTDFNENCDKETLNYLYDCLKKSEKM